MKVLITNDDGPLNDEFSPYIRPFIQKLVALKPDWEITVVVPDVQKSWIAKAHLAGHNPSMKFIYSKLSSTDNSYLGPYIEPQGGSNLPFQRRDQPRSSKLSRSEYIEWVLIDATPASCANIALFHLNTKFDLVVSGPNVGRNASAAYITSSATVGAAMEAVITADTRAIALSWAYYDGKKDASDSLMGTVAERSVKVLQHLYNHWDPQVDLYSVNVPLLPELTGVQYAPIWENRWGSIFDGPTIKERPDNLDIEDGMEHDMISFRWNPNFKGHRDSSRVFPGTQHDMLVIEKGGISVTPLRATFQHVPHLVGELSLEDTNYSVLITTPETEYIYKPLLAAVHKQISGAKTYATVEDIPIAHRKPLFHYGDYEQLDMDKLSEQNMDYCANSYIFRKALIRKHYLSSTIHNYVVKHPDSILATAFMETFTLDLDYAEFLDDSLDENWELRGELEEGKKWWIVKPSMSDKGQGIRVFKTIENLQRIFDSFDDEPEEANSEDEDENKIVISQLRHFIVQQYLANPLLLRSMGNRKFHIRCYITCKGNLEVFVYDRMLALFAPTPYLGCPADPEAFDPIDLNTLQCHLTNTCLQKDDSKSLSVVEFDNLEDIAQENKRKVKNQIHAIAHDVFLAATTVSSLNFQPLRNAFETYGVDFLVDSEYNVKLLEINAYPDFKQTGDELKGLIDELFQLSVKHCIRPLLDGVDSDEDDNFKRVLSHTPNKW